MGLFSKVTDTLGLTDTEGAKDAIRDANRLDQQALEDAKNIIRLTTNEARTLQGTGASRAVALLRQGQNRQLRELDRGFDATTHTFQPFVDIAQSSITDFARGATPEGFAANIDFLSNSGVLDPLINERRRAEEARLGQLGLSRSSGGFESVADIGTDTLLGVEDLLAGRLLNTATSTLPFASGLGTFQNNLGINRANVVGGTAGDIANIRNNQFINASQLVQDRGINEANIGTRQGAASARALLAAQQADQAPGQFAQDLIQGLVSGAANNSAIPGFPV